MFIAAVRSEVNLTGIAVYQRHEGARFQVGLSLHLLELLLKPTFALAFLMKSLEYVLIVWF
jgi:hypothetical protein